MKFQKPPDWKSGIGLGSPIERAQGRKPQPMGHGSPGYDVQSRQGLAVHRYIEVKGIDGEWGVNRVPLSRIQFLEKARELGDKFWLYVVEPARDPQRVRIHPIQNPYSRTTQIRFDHGWRAAAEVIAFKPLEPKVGLKIYLKEGNEYLEGLIVHADLPGATWLLRVDVGPGPSRSVVYNPEYMQLAEPES